MPLYQILNSDNRLKPFRSTELSSRYVEKDLEDWLEENPQVLVSDEPLLIIGRQVSTPVGTIDLLALDAEGAIVVVELKRAPDQRKIIAQALEYAAWLSGEDEARIFDIAGTYLTRKKNISLADAWMESFDSKLPDLSPKTQHRIFVVIEGDDDRLVSVAKYLRSSGVDINLLAYNFYRTESNDEILNIEKVVGDDGVIVADGQRGSQAAPTEAELLGKWSEEVREAYTVFKEKILQSGTAYIVKKTQISYRKTTAEGKVFVCGFHGSGRYFKIWLRSDTLNTLFDFQNVANEIQSTARPDVEIIHTGVWFIVTYPANDVSANEAAEIILEKILPHIE